MLQYIICHVCYLVLILKRKQNKKKNKTLFKVLIMILNGVYLKTQIFYLKKMYKIMLKFVIVCLFFIF